MRGGGTFERAARRVVVGTAMLAVLLWLCSYSWIVGVAPPTRWIDADASPWFVAEVAAVVAGAASLTGGLLLAWLLPRPNRRPLLIFGAAPGGTVAALALLSLMAPP